MPAAGERGVAGVPQTRKEMRDNTHVNGFPFSNIDFMHKSSPQMLIYNLYAGKAETGAGVEEEEWEKGS